MLLRIIDRSSNEGGQQAIEIVLQAPDGPITFQVDDFESPLTKNFHQTLTWYFQKYLGECASDNLVDSTVVKDRGVPSKLISSGQYLADRLQDEDFHLMQVKDVIEEQGYQDLEVCIESSKIAFFHTFWELLVLPESPYVLCAASHGFFRRFPSVSNDNYEDAIHYKLPVGKEASGKGEDGSLQNPLRILRLVAQVDNLDSQNLDSHVYDTNLASNSYSASFQAMRWQGLIEDTLWLDGREKALREHLSDSAKPTHILHYDGPVVFKQGIPQIYTSRGEAITVASLSKSLVENGVALLCVNASAYLNCDNEGEEISPDIGLASVAHVATASGLYNVLGLGHISDPWTSQQCFQAVYDCLPLGISFNQAVVEARKHLQANIESDIFTVSAQPFHAWPLLIHYGGQSLHFFEAATPSSKQASEEEGDQCSQEAEFVPPKPVEFSLSSTLEGHMKQVFGFDNTVLIPQTDKINGVGDEVVLKALSTSSSVDMIWLYGEVGIGKTHAAQRVGFAYAQRQHVVFSFYFDMAEGFYYGPEVYRMVAPILDCPADAEESVIKECLANIRCCFVFDNLDAPSELTAELGKNEPFEALNPLFSELFDQGHKVVVTTCSTAHKSENYANHTDAHNSAVGRFLNDFNHKAIEVSPLAKMSQQVLAVQVFESTAPVQNNEDSHKDDTEAEANLDDALNQLLPYLHGHPFLICNIVPQLNQVDVNELQRACEQYLPVDQKDKVDSYYAWQWSLLPKPWQTLLLLLSDPAITFTPNILLELFMIACDQGLIDKQGVESAHRQRSFPPAIALFESLGLSYEQARSLSSEYRFSSLLAKLTQAKFVRRHPQGCLLEPRCTHFLHEQRSQLQEQGEYPKKASLYISQMLCEGLKTVVNHLQKQANPVMSQYVLNHRQSWFQHLEVVWFAEQYRTFISVKNMLDALLMQSGLGQESIVWTQDLLLLVESPHTQDGRVERAAAWFALATKCLESKGLKAQGLEVQGLESQGLESQGLESCSDISTELLAVFEEAVSHWHGWLESSDFIGDSENDEKQLTQGANVLFHSAALFLQSFYRNQGVWNECLSIADIAFHVYQRHQVWPKVVENLRLLAQCSFALNDDIQGAIYEDALLDEALLAQLHVQVRVQLQLDTLMTMVSRGDGVRGQVLLDSLRNDPNTRSLHELLDLLQLEIHTKTANYSEALSLGGRLWMGESQPNSHFREKLFSLLKSMKESLGESEFAALSQEVLGYKLTLSSNANTENPDAQAEGVPSRNMILGDQHSSPDNPTLLN